MGPGLPPRVLCRFWIGTPRQKGLHGSHADRARPSRLRVEEVPPADYQSGAVSGHEEEAVLRESGHSPATERQNGGTPQSEKGPSSGTLLSQESTRHVTHDRDRE